MTAPSLPSSKPARWPTTAGKNLFSGVFALFRDAFPERRDHIADSMLARIFALPGKPIAGSLLQVRELLWLQVTLIKLPGQLDKNELAPPRRAPTAFTAHCLLGGRRWWGWRRRGDVQRYHHLCKSRGLESHVIIGEMMIRAAIAIAFRVRQTDQDTSAPHIIFKRMFH